MKTLDLEERAERAINAITRSTNADNDFACWFYVSLNRKPPTAHRQIRLYGKSMEALALARRITHGELNTHVDRIWHDALLNMLREQKPVLTGPEGGRQLAWLAAKWEDTGESVYRELGERAIRRGLRAAVHRDDYCYFGPEDPRLAPIGWDATSTGWTVQGLAQFYDATGSDVALELGHGLARFLKDHASVFDAQGRFLARHDSPKGPALHFHHNANALEGLMEYAYIAGDAEFAEFARLGYEYARSMGSPLVGFFPEYIDDWPDDRGFVDCEGCCVADMIQLAMRLSLAGAGDYWDDVDRYVRNQFSEMQMGSSEWVYRMVDGLEPTQVGRDEAGDQVPERNVGSFAGWSTANDFYGGAHPGIMHCCTGNCTRALYYLWDHMVELADDELKVHLLLNRECPCVEVRSEIPYRGRVTIDVKRPIGAIALRAPEWVANGTQQMRGELNGIRRELVWDGRYVKVGSVARGDRLLFEFPIESRTVRERIGDVDYELVIRGNNVVSISPAGRYCPFYQSDVAY